MAGSNLARENHRPQQISPVQGIPEIQDCARNISTSDRPEPGLRARARDPLSPCCQEKIVSESKFARTFTGIAIGSLVALAGCLSGCSNTPSTVLAQSGYSTASLSGSYAFELVAAYDKNTPGLTYEQIGTITLDGSGNVTGGNSTAYFSGTSSTCAFTLSGTYSVQTSGAGKASLTSSPATASQPAGCGANTVQLAIEVAGSGSTFMFAETDGDIFSGSAAKQ